MALLSATSILKLWVGVMRRRVCWLAALTAWGLALAPLAMAQQAEDADALNTEVNRLYREGKYSEATPLAQRSLAISEKALGPDHPDVGVSLNNLAGLYRVQGRFVEAEPLYRRSLAISEKALGPDHPDVALLLQNMGGLYRAQGRYAEAEPLYRRGLAIREKALGPDHPAVGRSLNNLAALYRDQGRYAEAEPLFRRALAISEKALGPNDREVGRTLNNLAELYRDQGRYAEAEPLYQRCLAIYEKALGPDHPDVGTLLNNLAGLYDVQGRYAEAEPLYQRGLAIAEKALGPDHPSVAGSLNNLAELYRAQGRYAEAEPLAKRCLAILEKALGPDHPKVGASLNNLGLLYRVQGRYAEAEPLFKRALAISEKALGPDHPDVGVSLNNLAALYRVQDRYAEAEQLYRRALGIYEKALGPDHPNVATSLHNLALLYLAESDWARATAYGRRASNVTVRRTERGAVAGVNSLHDNGKSEAAQSRGHFWGVIKAAYRLAAQRRNPRKLTHEMFETAQWAQGSEAAKSLAQMTARGAKDDPTLASIVRERQDLVAEWAKRDGARTGAVSQSPDKRDNAVEAANIARMSAIDARITEIDKRLAGDFPNYAAFASPKPLSVEQVQSDLSTDEALVLFFDTPDWKPTPEETFIWVVTKTASHWVRSELGTSLLKREVAALRCGLDYDGSWAAPASRCAELLQIAYSENDYTNGKPLPFDIDRAHNLYTALFGQIEEMIKGKHLLIVPSGALTQLPFQVLVSEKPDPAQTGLDVFRRATWLVRNHALTVLPSVSSLRALRELGKDSHANRALVGFGNPLLDGQPDLYPDDKPRAVQARANQSCSMVTAQHVAHLDGERRGMPPSALRGGLADVRHIRLQTPLPETADELCAVARDSGVGDDDIWLGARATETEMKRLSGAGELAKYRLIHFATHGALAGQMSGEPEPGLLLSRPIRRRQLMTAIFRPPKSPTSSSMQTG